MARTDLSALWTLSRPRGAPWVAALPLLGFAWAHWDRALTLQAGAGILGLMAAWWLLHAGTLWLNAWLDRDQGEVLFGRAVPVPASAPGAAALALGAGTAVAALVDPAAGLCAGGCAVLAVLYSHPATAWKGHPVLGPAVNVAGYAGLAPLAGWLLVGVGATPRTLVSWGLLATWILGATFAAQVFQGDEDAARGYRTLVATRGPVATLGAARALLGGTVLVVAALAAAGWYPRPLLLALPAYAWADAWMRRRPLDAPGWGRTLFGRLLVFAWVALALVAAEYARESLAGQPVAGLGTAAGHPADRPLLAPARLRRWERLKSPG